MPDSTDKVQAVREVRDSVNPMMDHFPLYLAGKAAPSALSQAETRQTHTSGFCQTWGNVCQKTDLLASILEVGHPMNAESYNSCREVWAAETPMTARLRFLSRLWYYFRIGYATYLTFLLGVMNTLIVVWYLAIAQMPQIESIFGHFLPFAVVTIVVGVPLSIAIGWTHLKRIPAYSSEMDIGVEANPYYYKLPPGFNREAFAPLYLELLTQMTRLLDAQKLLTKEDKSRIEALQQKMRLLVEGGSVGTPRTRI